MYKHGKHFTYLSRENTKYLLRRNPIEEPADKNKEHRNTECTQNLLDFTCTSARLYLSLCFLFYFILSYFSFFVYILHKLCTSNWAGIGWKSGEAGPMNADEGPSLNGCRREKFKMRLLHSRPAKSNGERSGAKKNIQNTPIKVVEIMREIYWNLWA